MVIIIINYPLGPQGRLRSTAEQELSIVNYPLGTQGRLRSTAEQELSIVNYQLSTASAPTGSKKHNSSYTLQLKYIAAVAIVMDVRPPLLQETKGESRHPLYK